MTLDNFRKIDMQINRANDYQLETQFAKEGDYNGRELVVQITNAGEVSNQTGVSLNLGWHHDDAGNSGLDHFTVVDASKGIFKITYPTEMLIAGDVTATIQVIENGKITLTRNFKITVEYSPIDEGAIVSENSFTALQDALKTVNQYDNRISTLELSKADKSNVVSQSEFDSWVATLLDGGPSIFMNTLIELQTTYPNGAAGVALVRETDPAKIYVWNGTSWESFGDYQGVEVKDGSITSTKLSDGAVTPEKTAFIEKGKNFIDKDNYIEDYSLNSSTGVVVPLTGGAVTPHFPVPANTQMTQNFSYVICFYDGSGNFISGLPQSTPFIERTFTTPANAVTARTAVWQANLMASYQVELGNVSTPYEDYRISLKNFKLPTRSLGQSEMKAPFGYILSGRQIVVDWATKKMSGTITSVYYDDTQILPTNTSFSLDITLNNVSWLYLDLVDGAFKTAIKGQPKGRILVIMEIYATSAAFYYYAPYRPAIRLINYTGQVLQHLNGREIIDRTIEENKLSDSVQFKLNTISENGYNRLFTLNDAYVAWENGEKFPIAFYGDSTTDGVGTTDWVGNVVGQDSSNTNAYPKRMEEKLRQATGNSQLRIYNAGFSGKTASWGLTNFNDVFLDTSTYSDVKMIGISWGINDRVLYTTEKAFRAGFKSDIKGLIDKCYANNIQPFLVTTQMVISPGVDTTQSQYLLREATSIETIANEVKRELAVELNLELIDTHDFTERFVKHSKYSAQAIIPDKLHFGDVGHEFESQMYFAKLYPKTNWVNKPTQLDYTNQRLVVGVPENKLTIPTSVTDSFKVFANYEKEDSIDTLIYKVYVFNDSDSLKTLKAFKSDVTSLTYVKVNGVSTTLDTLEKTISTLDIGLHTLEVYSGASATVDFKGFKLE